MLRSFACSDLPSALRAHLLELLALPKDSFVSVELADAPNLALQFSGNRIESTLWFDLPAVWLTPLQLPFMYELAGHYGVECVEPDEDDFPPVFVRNFAHDLDRAVALARDVFDVVYNVAEAASMVAVFDVLNEQPAQLGASA